MKRPPCSIGSACYPLEKERVLVVVIAVRKLSVFFTCLSEELLSGDFLISMMNDVVISVPLMIQNICHTK